VTAESLGCSSTQRSNTGVTGVDTLRLLFEVERVPTNAPRIFDLDGSFKAHVMPGLHLIAAEGNPLDGGLWRPQEVAETGARVASLVDATFGVRRERGASRVDLTTSRRFDQAAEGRAFLTGMAAMELPRLEGSRRPNVGQARSIHWTGARTAAIKARVYCESFKVEGRQLGERVRMEAQGRMPNGARPPLDVVADPSWQAERFRRRFEPIRKAVDGVKASSMPAAERAIIDDVKAGRRDYRQAERLLGALVILRHDKSAYPKMALSRRRRELREAGYAIVDDLDEQLEVDLGAELERALAEFAA
jgi:hypothetical protein